MANSSVGHHPTYLHATIPGLPPHLWQAAFFLDMIHRPPQRPFGPEVLDMAERLSRLADEVIERRKAKLGR